MLQPNTEYLQIKRLAFKKLKQHVANSLTKQKMINLTLHVIRRQQFTTTTKHTNLHFQHAKCDLEQNGGSLVEKQVP